MDINQLKIDLKDRIEEIHRLANRATWTPTQISALASQLTQANNAVYKMLGIIENPPVRTIP